MIEGAMTFSIQQARIKRRKAPETGDGESEKDQSPSETFSIAASSLVRRPVKKMRIKIDQNKLKALQRN